MFPAKNLIVASALDAPFRLGVGSSPAHFTHSDLTVSGSRFAPEPRCVAATRLLTRTFD
jgi:hypothetical protein